MLCPLCTCNKIFHKRSHTIPLWAVQEAKANGQVILQQVGSNDNTHAISQAGIYGEFMCVDCESKSSLADTYASLRFKQSLTRKDIPATIAFHYENGALTGTDWKNLDFRKIQMFVLGVILRQHLYDLRCAPKPKNLLGPYFDRLREIYWTGSNDSEFPIIIQMKSGDHPRNGQGLYPTKSTYVGNVDIIFFETAGYVFDLILTTNNISPLITVARLMLGGSILIPVDNGTGSLSISDTIKASIQQSKKVKLSRMTKRT